MSWALGVLLSEFTGRYQLTACGATGGSAEHEALFLLPGLREIGRDGRPVFLRGLGVAQVFAGLRGGLFGSHTPLYVKNNFVLICCGASSHSMTSPATGFLLRRLAKTSDSRSPWPETFQTASPPGPPRGCPVPQPWPHTSRGD